MKITRFIRESMCLAACMFVTAGCMVRDIDVQNNNLPDSGSQPPDGALPPPDAVNPLPDGGSGTGCGNGVVEVGEVCDDGNTVDGDRCSANCLSDETCGNGIADLAAGEECDDGNTNDGDGCDATCLPETFCLVTLDGGNPARVTSLPILASGTIGSPSTVTVAGEHTPYWGAGPMYDQAVAACGRKIYVALETSGDIAHLSMDGAGALTPVSVAPHPNAHGLVCNQSMGLLFAMSFADQNIGLDVFHVGPNGDLSPASTQTYVLPKVGMMDPDFTELTKLALAHRPGTNEQWILASEFNMMDLQNAFYGFRLRYDPQGNVQTLQGPIQISECDSTSAFVFNPEGTRLVMPGFSGGCFGWYEVGQQTNLPAMGSEIYMCSGPWGSGIDVALPRQSDLFYLMDLDQQGGAVIVTGGFDPNGPVLFSEVNGMGMRVHAKLVRGDSMLVTYGHEGVVATFSIDQNGTTLTPLDNATIPGAGYIESAVILPCSP